MNYINKINYRLILIIIFIILYLPHCFIMVSDISIITAYEVDPGSIIDSIEKLYSGKVYNMLNGYHSKFYGWTYMSINFWLLLPIKIFNLMLGINSKILFYLTLKFIYFSIGLVLTILVYKLSIKINRNNSCIAAFMATFLLLVMPTSSQFYFIHPETTGALFLVLAMLILSEYHDNGNKKYYILGIVCLSLASLSKQIFFFTALPIFIAYYYLGIKKFKFRPVALIFLTFGLGAFTLFVIHPYAYLYPKSFIGYQLELSTSLNGGNQIGYIASIKNWILFVYNDASILILPLIMAPILLAYSIYKYINYNSSSHLLLTVSCACVLISLMIVAYGNRISHAHHYLYPLYIFLLLIISFLIDAVTRLKYKAASIMMGLAFYGFIVTSLHYAYYSIPASISRLNFEKSVASVSYNYINQALLKGDKLVMDYQIAVPSGLGVIGCGMWTGCGTETAIGFFNPDYIMFDYQAARGISPSEFLAFKNYVKKNNYKLIDRLPVSGDYNIFTGRRTPGSEIMVYKR